MKIDCHVHIIGDGSSGSGAWIALGKMRTVHARYMLLNIKLPQSVLKTDLDQRYSKRVLEMLQESTLDKALILAHEEPYHEDGTKIEGVSPIYTPNDYVLKLAREHEEFLPAVAIHPARADALDELERCIEAGALVMKCLPNCQNINCNDTRYKKFWQRMADAKILLLAHTGGELSLPEINPAYANPEILRLPLECGVTTIAAHAGSNSLLDPNFIPVFLKMLKEHPNLYGDNSALNTPFRARHYKELTDVHDRLLHGSDMPIPSEPAWTWLRGYYDTKTYLKLRSIKNVIERDYQTKCALGFPEETFTKLSSLLKSAT